MNNAPAHISADSLSQYEYIDMMFILLNMTSTLQPINQSVIDAFKQLYHKSFLLNLLVLSENESGCEQLIKELNIYI